MKQQIFAAGMALAALASACGGNKPSGTDSHAEAEQTYLYANNKDTTRLVLKNAGAEISGSLDILPFEKDSRRGTLSKGEMKGDTLFALYKSIQEGQESECEIAFLKKGDAYVLTNDIFGEENFQYNADYSKGSFKNKQAIKFDGETLNKIGK